MGMWIEPLGHTGYCLFVNKWLRQSTYHTVLWSSSGANMALVSINGMCGLQKWYLSLE